MRSDTDLKIIFCTTFFITYQIYISTGKTVLAFCELVMTTVLSVVTKKRLVHFM